MPISPEHRAEINRNNARKSTGPKTPEGKAASSKNAMTHGLTATRIEPLDAPGEPPGAYQATRDLLLAALNPLNELETILIESIGRCSWKLDRCTRFEDAAAVKRQAARFGTHGSGTSKAKLAVEHGYFLRLALDHPAPPPSSGGPAPYNHFDDPPADVAALCTFKEGVEWLLNQWDITLPDLPDDGRPIPAIDYKALTYAESWATRLLSCFSTGAPPSLPLREAGRAEVRRLEALHATLAAEVPSRLDADLALFDAGPESQLVLRYAAEANRTLHRSMEMLLKLRKDPSLFAPPPEVAAEAAPSPEPAPSVPSPEPVTPEPVRPARNPSRRTMPPARNEAMPPSDLNPDPTPSTPAPAPRTAESRRR